MRLSRPLFLTVLAAAAPALWAQPGTPAADPALPVNARPGECYARVYIAPQFRTVSETVLKTAASERIEIIPEQYEWVDETVLVKPASERVVQVLPAEYRTVEEQVLVKPASERIEEIPATYRTVEETELVKPATTMWKPGRGLIEKVDNMTGDIMCLVEVPAEYRTVKKQVIDTPASTRRIPIPAEYQTVRRQELVREAQVIKETVPAQYQTVKVRKLVSPAREQRLPVPAEYQTLTRQEKVADGRMEWKSVLCETNATPETVLELQQALARAGYDPGKIDGRLGAQTLEAVKSYQGAQGLAQGGVTLETLERLGVRMRSSAGGI
ncbi:MAG TPA: peptidoglycan-binding domain-containing protein [Nevskiaceae bacterium]|nr:peptidoglycan-binding domain-containing protein [Nevskiaceae bacterium]